MVIDSSAIRAILRSEPEERSFLAAIKGASIRLLGAATRVEIGIVALSRRGERGQLEALALLDHLRIDVVPLSNAHADFALEALRRFGKGRHPAGLNFGDCLSYALAEATGEPLLFKGSDFALTDVKAAI